MAKFSQADWLLTESKARTMLGFKNAYTFKCMRRALGLNPLVGHDGRERYALADVERVIRERMGSAKNLIGCET